MSRAANQRIQVPDDLREVLLEFTISYLLEQPANVVHYAADYFTRLRESHTAIECEPPPPSGDGEGVPTSPDESVISNEDEVREEQKAESVTVLTEENVAIPISLPLQE